MLFERSARGPRLETLGVEALRQKPPPRRNSPRLATAPSGEELAPQHTDIIVKPCEMLEALGLLVTGRSTEVAQEQQAPRLLGKIVVAAPSGQVPERLR